MQIRVNRDGLVEKCREFARKNIPVQWALIDDMWADVPAFKGAVYSCRDEMISLMHGSALASFNADPDRFPGGLKAAVDEIIRRSNGFSARFINISPSAASISLRRTIRALSERFTPDTRP